MKGGGALDEQSELWARLMRGWNFLSQMIERGISAETLPLLQEYSAAARALTTLDADQAAAQHQTILGRAVPPHAGLFLNPGGRLTGEDRDSLLASYTSGGYRPPNPDLADALEIEMRFVARLLYVKIKAREDCRDEVILSAQLAEQSFLRRHFLRWLAPFCEALARQGDALYADVAALILELAAEHAASLPLADAIPPLPRPPDLLADPGTRLDDIAARFVAPALTGFLMDGPALRQMARDLELPVPLTNRQSMLAGLLRAAGEFDALPALLDALDGRAREAAQAYAAMMRDLPVLTLWVEQWQARAEETRTFLAGMRDAYSSV